MPAWTQVVNACTIDESDVNDAQFSNKGFSFKGGSTKASVSAWCNVTNPLDTGNPSWNGLIVGHLDPDGISNNAQVTAKLYRVYRSPDLFAGLHSLVANFDSNQWWYDETAWHEGIKIISSKFDFLSNEYVVQITLSRTNTALNPYVTALRISTLNEIVP